MWVSVYKKLSDDIVNRSCRAMRAVIVMKERHRNALSMCPRFLLWPEVPKCALRVCSSGSGDISRV